MNYQYAYSSSENNLPLNGPVVCSITSGKGGVGKTNLSVNIAYLLGQKGYKTMLLDADLGLGNVDVLLGLNPRFNIFHLLSNEVKLKNIIYKTKYNFNILPAPSGVCDLLSLSPGQKLEFLEAMDSLEDEVDFFLVDTGAGINDNVLYFNMAAQHRIIVLTPEPTSLTDSYALIKVLHLDHKINKFYIIVNLCRDYKNAKDTFKRLYLACDHFLKGVSLNLLGYVPRDMNVRHSVTEQVPFCYRYPDTLATKSLKSIVTNLETFKNYKMELDGNIKFFWKKLLFLGQ